MNLIIAVPKVGLRGSCDLKMAKGETTIWFAIFAQMDKMRILLTSNQILNFDEMIA